MTLSEDEAHVVGRLMAVTQHGAKGGPGRSARFEALERLSAEADDAFGEDSALALRVRLSLENSRNRDRNSRASLEAFQDLERRCERKLALAHPVFLSVRIQVAIHTRMLGDVGGGIELYQEELRLRTDLFGASSRRSSVVRQNLASALCDRGSLDDLESAENISRDEHKARLLKSGPGHPSTWVSQMNIANALIKRVEQYPGDRAADRDRAEEVLALAQDVAQGRRATYGPLAMTTIGADRTRARALLALGKPDAAVWALRRLVALERGGSQVPGLTLTHLARALRASSEPGSGEEAERIAGVALEAMITKYGEASPKVAVARRLLASP